MALMSLRSRSRVKASVVLTRADHLCIHIYIRSLLNIILRPTLLRLNSCPIGCSSGILTACMKPKPTEQRWQHNIYIYSY